MGAGEIVQAYWDTMGSNDFAQAAKLLTPDVVIDWPQTNERITGRAEFTRINTVYPTSSLWRFDVLSIVVQGDQVVTVTQVSNDQMQARAITLSTVDMAQGLIAAQVEYWPDASPPPTWRAGMLPSIPAHAPHKMR